MSITVGLKINVGAARHTDSNRQIAPDNRESQLAVRGIAGLESQAKLPSLSDDFCFGIDQLMNVYALPVIAVNK
jgi:hypothetical protein